MPLTADRIRALRDVRDVVTAAGGRCVLIGAAVPLLLVSSGNLSRVTFDVDTIVSTRTWADYEALRSALQARGFRRGSLYRMFSPEGVQVDLIPFGEGIVDDNQIAWPDGGRMSALGLAEALETAAAHTIDGTFVLDVVPQATFVLLKLIAYQDRPEERHRDVADIVAVCEEYESDTDRRYEAVGETVDAVEISFDLAGAFVLGRDIRSIAHRDSFEAVAKLFARIPDDYATPVRHVLIEERRTSMRNERGPQIFRLFRVLQAGLGLISSPPA